MVNITEEIKSEFNVLVQEVEKQVELNSTAELMITVKTAKGNIYTCVNHNILSGDYEDENQFIKMLVDKDDVKIKYFVCMWSSGELEVPFAHFRNSILEICPENENAIWVAQGADKLILRTIKDSMP